MCSSDLGSAVRGGVLPGPAVGVRRPGGGGGQRSPVKVTIPDGITVIGRSAFKDCSGISRISIGKSVTKIGDRAFENCKSLNSVNIPEALTYLGDDAFMECSNLQSEIIIPDAVTNSLRKAFYNCAKLPKVKIGAGVKKIDEMAFAGSGITEITIPSNVKSIEKC